MIRRFGTEFPILHGMGRGGLLVLVMAFAGGCGGVSLPFEGLRAQPGVAFPFAPAAMRIHPLSRIEEARTIVCHVEFRDTWGDTAKASGQLVIELVDAGAAEGPVRWDIDLSDLDANGRLYDPATRTYRIRLREAPEWVSPGSSASLRASWSGTDADGQALALEDEHEVR